MEDGIKGKGIHELGLNRYRLGRWRRPVSIEIDILGLSFHKLHKYDNGDKNCALNV